MRQRQRTEGRTDGPRSASAALPFHERVNQSGDGAGEGGKVRGRRRRREFFLRALSSLHFATTAARARARGFSVRRIGNGARRGGRPAAATDGARGAASAALASFLPPSPLSVVDGY